jgi:hypothetical protein
MYLCLPTHATCHALPSYIRTQPLMAHICHSCLPTNLICASYLQDREAGRWVRYWCHSSSTCCTPRDLLPATTRLAGVLPLKPLPPAASPSYTPHQDPACLPTSSRPIFFLRTHTAVYICMYACLPTDTHVTHNPILLSRLHEHV